MKLDDGSLAAIFEELDAREESDQEDEVLPGPLPEQPQTPSGSSAAMAAEGSEVSQASSSSKPEVSQPGADAASSGSKPEVSNPGADAGSSASMPEVSHSNAGVSSSAAKVTDQTFQFFRMMQETEVFVKRPNSDVLPVSQEDALNLRRKTVSMTKDEAEMGDEVAAAIDEEIWSMLGKAHQKAEGTSLSGEPDARPARNPPAITSERVTTLSGAMQRAIAAHLKSTGRSEVEWTGKNRMVMGDVMMEVWRFIAYLRYGGGYGCDNKLLPNPLRLCALVHYFVVLRCLTHSTCFLGMRR